MKQSWKYKNLLLKNLSGRNFIVLLSFFLASNVFPADTTLVLKKSIRGSLSPKSVVYNGNGLFFAQNMMYRHTIHVYNSDYKLMKVISDKVTLGNYGHKEYQGEHLGAPVECAFSHNGKFAWVSNYTMTGKGFEKPGCDECTGTEYDPGFIYKINTSSLEIENVIKAGSVPKFLCATPDNNYLLVSNWSSADISVISLEKNEEIKRIPVGRFPRGIAIDSKNKYAYVAIMGGISIARIDLENFTVEKFAEPGRAPRHLCIDRQNLYLYVTLNSEGALAKINLVNGKTEKLFIGGTPRSMVMSADDRFIYVVNYSSAKITKVRTENFTVCETASTGPHPIGITYNAEKGEVWVACYSGSIMIYKDKDALIEKPMLSEYAAMIPALNDFYSSAVKILTPPEGFRSEVNRERERETALKKQRESEKEKIVHIEKNQSSNDSPEKENKSVLPVPVNSGKYFVIVGSFKNKDNAIRQKQDMIARGYSCDMITRSNGFHSAAVGGYQKKNDAEKIMEEIKKKEKMDAWVWQSE